MPQRSAAYRAGQAFAITLVIGVSIAFLCGVAVVVAKTVQFFTAIL